MKINQIIKYTMGDYAVPDEDALFDIIIGTDLTLEICNQYNNFYYSEVVGTMESIHYNGTFLEFAIMRKFKRIIYYFIDYFKSFDSEQLKYYLGKYFLFSVESNDIEIVKIFLDLNTQLDQDKQFDINGNNHGKTYHVSSIRESIYNGNLQMINMLLDYGASFIDPKIFEYETFLTMVLRREGFSLDEKINIFNRTKAFFKNKKSFKKYINLLPIKNKQSCLETICGCDDVNFDIVKLLLENGADISINYEQTINSTNSTNSNKSVKKPKIIKHHKCCLPTAVISNRLDIVKILCEYGADVNCKLCKKNKDIDDRLLNNAVKFGSLPLIRFLIQKGLKITKKTEDNCANPFYSLICSYRQNKIELAKYLMSIGVKHEMNLTKSAYENLIESFNDKYNENIEFLEDNFKLLKYFGDKFVSFKNPYKNYKYLTIALNTIKFNEISNPVFDYLVSKIGSNIKRSKTDMLSLHMICCNKLSLSMIKQVFSLYDVDDINEHSYEKYKTITNHSSNRNSLNNTVEELDQLSCLSCIDLVLKRHQLYTLSDEEIKKDMYDIITFLIEKGANVNNSSIITNNTSILTACKTSNPIYIDLMVELGADVIKHNDMIRNLITTAKIKDRLSDLALEKIFDEKSFGTLIKEKLYEEAYAKYDIECTHKNVIFEDGDVCLICWENNIDIQSECFHNYCHTCFKNVILKNIPCAMCRRAITKKIYLINQHIKQIEQTD